MEALQDAPAVRPGSNSGAWAEWMRRWMLDEPFSITTDSIYLPGNESDSMASSLNAVFLLEDIVTYKVIPDAADIDDLVYAAKQNESGEVGNLFGRLKNMSSLDPTDHSYDSSIFEKFGFHVIGTSLYLGSKLFSSDSAAMVDVINATPLHSKRLGLVKWVHSEIPGFRLTTLRVLGVSTGQKGIYYPYTNHIQETLEPAVQRILDSNEYSAVFILTGANTNCDYLYLFRKSDSTDWIALVADGKHTDCHSATLSATDQTKLTLAAVTLKNALADKLVAHRQGQGGGSRYKELPRRKGRLPPGLS